jgi:predicted HTH transcriptional regulator
MYVLYYINPHVPDIRMKKIIDYICNKDNGFITFTVKDNVKDNMLSDVLNSDLNEPPKNKLRKVIFKDSTGLSAKQKLRIVGELIGKARSVNNNDIYECMLEINNSNARITIAKLAKILGCSSRTIHRNMDKELKNEKDILNIQNEEI